MNTRPFFQVVPKSVQLWAWITVVATAVIALTMGILTITAHHGSLWTIPLYTLAGLFTGTLFATWLLGLGFVYADARRRAMQPVLWVMVALLVPHLLGFLLYFVLRQPLASPCGHCGQQIPSGQRFCSWCGTPSPSGNAPSPSVQTSR